MKNYKQIWTTLSVFLFISNGLMAQFTLSGSFRSRLEVLDGYSTLLEKDDKADVLINQQTRLTAKYKNDKIETFLMLQDARVWGDEAYSGDNIIPNTSATTMHQAWAKYFINPNLGIKVGRTELAYDDQRLFGNRVWKTHAYAHDLALLEYEDEAKGIKLHVGYALNNISEGTKQTSHLLDKTGKETAYKSKAYLWFNKKTEALNASFYAILDAYQVPNMDMNNGTITSNADKTNKLVTVGPFIEYNKGSLGFEGSFYYQTGKRTYALSNLDEGQELGMDVNAMFWGLSLKYKIEKVKFLAQWDHYSGTAWDNSEAYTDNSFRIYSGGGHKFTGYMDFFGVVIADKTKNRGLDDYYLRANITFSEKANLELTYHNFALAKEFSETVTDKGLGSEIDIVQNIKLSKDADLQLGYCVMLPSDVMKEHIFPVTDAKFAQFAYIQLAIKPTFFKSEQPKPTN
jgi:hypothetical protein